ncbi:HAMP domain-containing sensor histidine kinase [Parabacteroides sp. ZJ-118]|uniref:sensor histidine kinase n=1 Tax=Parabacteroides sp. ZJ-118 TaxID=2709398 RepID=UPI0013EB2363|nr:HAMP domain-containing sensor histidine kinase [Parabacteroides sp. ZJ-118]
MWVIYLLLSFMLCYNPVTQAQDTTNQFMTQAQNSLEKKDYTKARYLFLQAYKSSSQKGDYQQAIDAGTQAVYLYYRENYYQEAFNLCRQMDQFILTEEQKLQQPLYEQHFQITKERLEMYIKLKNAAQAQVQLNILDNLASQAGDEQLSNNLLYTQAGYYYTFGQNEQGDAAFQKLINWYKEKKEYDKVSDCYRNLISSARKANNAPLMERTYEKYIVWTDSVKALTAKDQLGALQQKYDQSLQTIQEKDDKLSVKQSMIVGLITFVVILIAALLFLGFLLLRFVVLNKKLKKIIQTTNEHSEQQAQFIQNLSVQMEPTLSKLNASAKELQEVAPKQAEDILARVEALKRFTTHIQQLSSLENTLMEPYEVSSFNVGNFGKKIVEKVKGEVKPEVNLVTDIPPLEIKTNAEHLEQVLLHLLRNAALYTSSGNIRLEFKRKGAHVCQFIITDNGTGIPDDLKENLFKPFNEAKDLAQGDGLGLPICALMASKLNGTLSIDKEYKKGCRFILVLQI